MCWHKRSEAQTCSMWNLNNCICAFMLMFRYMEVKEMQYCPVIQPNGTKYPTSRLSHSSTLRLHNRVNDTENVPKAFLKVSY